MKKFIMTSPYQPKGRLEGNREMKYNAKHKAKEDTDYGSYQICQAAGGRSHSDESA